MPSLQAIFLLREDKGTYRWFCDTFLKEIHGKREFDKITTMQNLSDYITVSDEAFALITVQNSYEKIESAITGNSNVKSKYTKSGATPHGKNELFGFKYGGWSKEGILVYNNLFDKIAQDRIKNKYFDEYFKQYKMKQNKIDNDNPEGKNEEMYANLSQKTCWENII